MTIQETLQKVGLGEKEAKIYLALLELGQATVLELAKNTHIKRPTVYVVLGEMVQKGYVAKALKEKKVRYVAQGPEVILGELTSKESLLRNVIGELIGLRSPVTTRPRISVFEGIGGVTKIYNEILQSSEVRFFSSLKQVKKYFEVLITPFSSHSTLHVKDILADDPMDRAYVTAAKGPHYEARFMPAGLGFSIDLAIFGNKVAISSVKKELFTVVIESEEIATSLRNLHMLLWDLLPPVGALK